MMASRTGKYPPTNIFHNGKRSTRSGPGVCDAALVDGIGMGTVVVIISEVPLKNVCVVIVEYVILVRSLLDVVPTVGTYTLGGGERGGGAMTVGPYALV